MIQNLHQQVRSSATTFEKTTEHFGLQPEKKEGIRESGNSEDKKQIIKGALSSISSGLKENLKRKSPSDKNEGYEYKQLEKQIKNLGIDSERSPLTWS